MVPARVTQTISDQKTLNVLQQAKKWIHSILELFLAKRNELSFNGIKSTKKCIKITVSMRVERNSQRCFQALLFARLSLSRNFAKPLFLTVSSKFVLLQLASYLEWDVEMWRSLFPWLRKHNSSHKNTLGTSLACFLVKENILMANSKTIYSFRVLNL